MSLIKKVDVEEYFAARRAMRLGRARPMSQQPKATVIERSGTAANAPRSIGSFILRLSSPSIPAVVIPIAGFGAKRNRTSRGSGQQ
jgi:hypothetical protein